MVRAFVTSAGEAVTQGETRDRATAVAHLRDELVRREVATVVETLEQAQLVVEVRGVYGAEEGPILRSAKHAARLPHRYRIVVVRVRAGGFRDDFACRDSSLGVLAEQEAADRIRLWWTDLPRRTAFLADAREPAGMAAAS